MKFLLVIFSLVLIAFATESAKAEVYYPSDDKSCISDGLNWSYAVNCTDDFIINPYSPNVWTVYIGQDCHIWNDEARTIFKFIHNISSDSEIENATFCAYVYWGHCNQVAPKYMCSVGDVYASHIYVPGAINVSDYNSTVLETERIWLPNQNGAPIGNGRYWCVDATDWVADDVESGRESTSVRLHITQHHVIVNVSANSNRIYSRLSPINKPYLEVEYSYNPVPTPTNRSLIITDADWQNVAAASPARIPVLVSEAENITPEIGRFLQEYGPDTIYTLGFSLGLNNSFEISREQVPELFFPNASKAVYANSREKGILAGQVGYFLEIPVVFEKAGYSEILDLENMSFQETQDFYLERVKERGGNVDYLVLADLNSSEGLLAGRLAGLRNGSIVPVENKSFEGIRKVINNTLDLLGSKKLYYRSLKYKKGEPLYLAILGGNESVPFVRFFDPGMEILNNKDGWWLYSDLGYADSNGDGYFDLAIGRIEDGFEGASLHMARQSLEKNQSAVLIGEYRYPKIADLKFFGGGMTEAFLAQMVLDRGNVSTKRIVEQRIGEDINNLTIEEASWKLGEIMLKLSVKMLIGSASFVWTFGDATDSVMYAVLELDWQNWSGKYMDVPAPVHLEIIDEKLNGKIGSPGIIGYFGVGEKEWIIPKEKRPYFGLLFKPYDFGDGFSNLTFSGFLYDEHDMSANSTIKEKVLKEGGSVLALSGVVHDPYAIYTSAVFFRGLSAGMPLGQALTDSANLDPGQSVMGFLTLNFIYSRFGFAQDIIQYPLLHTKDRLERILFADPAIAPVNGRVIIPNVAYSATPFHSFRAESWIESNYTLEGMEVLNADEHLIEREMPIVPVFAREFVLPEGAAVKWVNVSGVYFLANASPVFVYNDSYYSNWTGIVLDCVNGLGLSGLEELNGSQEEQVMECFENELKPEVDYPYPNSSFWWRENKLLDNRTLVVVFVPAFIFENESSTRVLESANVEVDYEAQVEMNVFAKDAFLGGNTTVRAEIMNLGEEVSGKLWMFVEGNGSFEFSENVTIPENSSLEKEFSFLPGLGYYEVIGVLESENSVGPRYAYFSVEEPPKLVIEEIPEMAVNEGETGNFQIGLENSGSFELKNISIAYEGQFALDFGENWFDMGPGESKIVTWNVSVPEGQAPGIYKWVLDFMPGNDRNVSANFTVRVPARAVPEIEQDWVLVEIEPGKYSERGVSLGNSGNSPLEMGFSSEGFSGISCEAVPQSLVILPGEEKDFWINASVPGGFTAGEYLGEVSLVGNEFSQPKEIGIHVKIKVPQVAHWSASPLVWACILPNCSNEFWIESRPESNAPLGLKISLEGLGFVSVQENASVGPGQKKSINASAEIPQEGLLSGVYMGNITLVGDVNSDPESQKISVTVLAPGPEFTLKKEFQPEEIRLFWKRFAVPKINHVEIFLNNTGDVPIEKINISDEIPDGWNGKKPVLSFVKRNKIAPVKDFVFSAGNGHANLSFDLMEKPLQKGEGLEVHYMIYVQPEFVPTEDAVTHVSGNARGHENVYSKGETSATLRVEYFDPPAWLRWLFVLVYRLW